MKYTTEQAVQKALSVSKQLTFGNSFVDLTHDELTEFANLIRKETLLEAAVEFDRMAHGVAGAGVFPEKLRRMAGE